MTGEGNVRSADAPDPDLVYAKYLKTCEMAGIEPVPPRERAGVSRFAVAPERFLSGRKK
jgi:hypothetical protein